MSGRYMTTATAARNWGLAKRTIAKYCHDDKISGAFKQGGQWYIPMDTLKPLLPKDERYFLRLILELKNRPEQRLDFEYEGINEKLVLPVCDRLLQDGLIKGFDRKRSEEKLFYDVCLTKKGMDTAFSRKSEKELDWTAIITAVVGIIPAIGEVVRIARG